MWITGDTLPTSGTAAASEERGGEEICWERIHHGRLGVPSSDWALPRKDGAHDAITIQPRS